MGDLEIDWRLQRRPNDLLLAVNVDHRGNLRAAGEHANCHCLSLPVGPDSEATNFSEVPVISHLILVRIFIPTLY